MFSTEFELDPERTIVALLSFQIILVETVA